VHAAIQRRLDAAIAPLRGRLATPALLIDLDAVDHNIGAVIRRCGGAPARWRPHIKTVKQAAILDRLVAAGITTLKCATLDELRLALAALDALADPQREGADVLLAFPLHQDAFHAALALAARHPRVGLTLLAETPDHARLLDAWAAAAAPPARPRLHLDVDLGMQRTGAPPARWLAHAAALARLSNLEIIGVHGYDGHLTWAQTAAAAAGYDALAALAERLIAAGAPIAEIVTSGSHTYPTALAHPALDGGPWRHQISPGTVLLGDLRVAAAADDLGLRQAAFVASRVISRANPIRLTLDAGTKAISPDRPPPTCEVLGWPELFPQEPSEEHLPVKLGGLTAPPFGHLLWLIPDHICTTVNLYRSALLLRGDEIIGESPIAAAGRAPWLL
jgi:D-serine deaminase-like pyridoxal phosphate-dependent protein